MIDFSLNVVKKFEPFEIQSEKLMENISRDYTGLFGGMVIAPCISHIALVLGSKLSLNYAAKTSSKVQSFFRSNHEKITAILQLRKTDYIPSVFSFIGLVDVVGYNCEIARKIYQ